MSPAWAYMVNWLDPDRWPPLPLLPSWHSEVSERCGRNVATCCDKSKAEPSKLSSCFDVLLLESHPTSCFRNAKARLLNQNGKAMDVECTGQFQERNAC